MDESDESFRVRMEDSLAVSITRLLQSMVVTENTTDDIDWLIYRINQGKKTGEKLDGLTFDGEGGWQQN